MSRPLRIEFPVAWYHVMNRGRRSEIIFSDKPDYLMFIRKRRHIMKTRLSYVLITMSIVCVLALAGCATTKSKVPAGEEIGRAHV